MLYCLCCLLIKQVPYKINSGCHTKGSIKFAQTNSWSSKNLSYAKIPEEKRIKLEDKNQKCIFLGYGENSSRDKLYNPITNKVVMSKDVEFDE